MSRQPLEPATTDAIARELIAAWPGWETLCGQIAQMQQDTDEGAQWLFNTVEQFVSQAVCRVAGHTGPLWSPVTGIVGDMHCSRCGENLG